MFTVNVKSSVALKYRNANFFKERQIAVNGTAVNAASICDLNST
jgi:hypothetical protein